jgi:hypothetical protein
MACMTPQLLARVRWSNVGIVALAALLLALVVAWPALSPEAPSLPADEPAVEMQQPVVPAGREEATEELPQPLADDRPAVAKRLERPRRRRGEPRRRKAERTAAVPPSIGAGVRLRAVMRCGCAARQKQALRAAVPLPRAW